MCPRRTDTAHARDHPSDADSHIAKSSASRHADVGIRAPMRRRFKALMRQIWRGNSMNFR